MAQSRHLADLGRMTAFDPKRPFEWCLLGQVGRQGTTDRQVLVRQHPPGVRRG